MADQANLQIQRLVALVAWMSQRDTGGPVRYREAARQLSVTEAQIKGDLQVLLNLTESYKPWLGSLSVAITAGGFILASRGAFRRPLRLSRDEALALIVGLTGERRGKDLARRLGGDFGAAPDPTDIDRTWAIGPTPGERVTQLLALARRARDDHRKLELLYCGSTGEPSRRVVHVHQVVQARGTWYLVAWCESAEGTRHFRVERIMDAALLEAGFTPREDLKRVTAEAELLAAECVPAATVAFSPRIARWMREKYPTGHDALGGRYLVNLPVADPRWLAREVLQYGAEAEVLAPEAMREFVKGMVG